jgi:hypothetical protein
MEVPPVMLQLQFAITLSDFKTVNGVGGIAHFPAHPQVTAIPVNFARQLHDEQSCPTENT